MTHICHKFLREYFDMQAAFLRKARTLPHGRLTAQKRCFFNPLFPPVAENHKIPVLPILKEIADPLQNDPRLNMQNTLLVGVQHMLPTTASLFDGFIEHLGFQPQNMFFSGKFYSSCHFVEDYIRDKGIHLMPTKAPKKPYQYKEHVQESMENMWTDVCTHIQKNPAIRKIIVLDEGGYCLASIPKYLPYSYDMASIEQTRFGFYAKHIEWLPFPIIDVARSAAKKKLESTLIAQAIIKRLDDVIHVLKFHQDKIFGVIGNGAIGHAVVTYLLAKGYKVLAYDESDSAFHGIHHQQCYRHSTLESVILNSDIVLGCTGKDISKLVDILNTAKNSTTLVSCSSQNIEFATFLKQITQDNIRLEKMERNLSQLVHIGTDGQEIYVLENGFPINFDRTPHSDPVNDMTLTRALLFSAVIQASFSAKRPIDDGITVNKNGCYLLDPHLQQSVVNKWIIDQPQNRYPKELIACFDNIEWIKANSHGEYDENFSTQLQRMPNSTRNLCHRL